MSNRDNGMTSVKVKIFNPIFIPQFAPEGFYGRNVVKRIHIKKIHVFVVKIGTQMTQMPTAIEASNYANFRRFFFL